MNSAPGRENPASSDLTIHCGKFNCRNFKPGCSFKIRIKLQRQTDRQTDRPVTADRNRDAPSSLGQRLMRVYRDWIQKRQTRKAATGKDVSGSHRRLKVGHDTPSEWLATDAEQSSGGLRSAKTLLTRWASYRR